MHKRESRPRTTTQGQNQQPAGNGRGTPVSVSAQFLAATPSGVQSKPLYRSLPSWTRRELLLLSCYSEGSWSSDWRVSTQHPLICLSIAIERDGFCSIHRVLRQFVLRPLYTASRDAFCCLYSNVCVCGGKVAPEEFAAEWPKLFHFTGEKYYMKRSFPDRCAREDLLGCPWREQFMLLCSSSTLRSLFDILAAVGRYLRRGFLSVRGYCSGKYVFK